MPLILTSAVLKSRDNLRCYQQWMIALLIVLNVFPILWEINDFPFLLELGLSLFLWSCAYLFILAIWNLFLWMAQINSLSIFSPRLFTILNNYLFVIAFYIFWILFLCLLKKYFLQFFFFLYFTSVLVLLSYKSFWL